MQYPRAERHVRHVRPPAAHLFDRVPRADRQTARARSQGTGATRTGRPSQGTPQDPGRQAVDAVRAHHPGVLAEQTAHHDRSEARRDAAHGPGETSAAQEDTVERLCRLQELYGPSDTLGHANVHNRIRRDPSENVLVTHSSIVYARFFKTNIIYHL